MFMIRIYMLYMVRILHIIHSPLQTVVSFVTDSPIVETIHTLYNSIYLIYIYNICWIIFSPQNGHYLMQLPTSPSRSSSVNLEKIWLDKPYCCNLRKIVLIERDKSLAISALRKPSLIRFCNNNVGTTNYGGPQCECIVSGCLPPYTVHSFINLTLSSLLVINGKNANNAWWDLSS